MFRIEIRGKRGDDGEQPVAHVTVPALPHVGDHIEYAPSKIAGYVKNVSFWWSERGYLTIIVTL